MAREQYSVAGWPDLPFIFFVSLHRGQSEEIIFCQEACSRESTWTVSVECRLTRTVETHFWCILVADSCGALKPFVNVATIRSDAFWFSAVP
jgi:hypothetical protein